MGAFDQTAVIVTALLIIAVVDDLRTQKVRNGFVLLSAAISLFAVFMEKGLSGLPSALSAGASAFVLCLPFVVLRIIGAGDLKIFTAVSFLLSPIAVLWSFLFSFIWGATLGLFQIILKGELSTLVLNYQALLSKKTRSSIQVHKVPYTVALLLGWLSWWSLSSRGWEGL